MRSPAEVSVRRAIVPLVAGLLLLGACSGDDGGSLGVGDPWARPTAPNADNAAFYTVISNEGETDDRLVGASSDRCAMTEIHETSMNDGVMSMAEADPDVLVIPADGDLVLEPGGVHVMCMRVTEPLVEGEELELQLIFEHADPVDVTVNVEQR